MAEQAEQAAETVVLLPLVQSRAAVAVEPKTKIQVLVLRVSVA